MGKQALDNASLNLDPIGLPTYLPRYPCGPLTFIVQIEMILYTSVRLSECLGACNIQTIKIMGPSIWYLLQQASNKWIQVRSSKLG